MGVHVTEKFDRAIIRLFYIDGSMMLTRYKTVKKKVKVRGRTKYVNETVTENISAGFLVTTFNASGELIQESILLNKADALTYEAERLFGIDLNEDNIQGRNVQEFDRDQFTTENNIETFEGASDNKTLVTDKNSGELLSADSSDPSLQKLLTYSDGSSFIPAS